MPLKPATEEQQLELMISDHTESARWAKRNRVGLKDYYVLMHETGFDFAFGKAFIFVERDDPHYDPRDPSDHHQWYLVTEKDINWVSNDIIDDLNKGVLTAPKLEPITGWLAGWL